MYILFNRSYWGSSAFLHAGKFSSAVDKEIKNYQNKAVNENEMDKLKKQLEEEKLKKMQAVNKLAEVMNRKEFRNHQPNKKNSAALTELKRKEKECRKLQQDLNMEKEKYNKMVEKYQRDLSETQAALYEEGQQRNRLQMELDAKESEIETLQQKLSINSEIISLTGSSEDSIQCLDTSLTSIVPSPSPSPDSHMEGWISVPNKQNIKKFGWKKQYVVVSSRKVLFYNSENDKQNADPALVLDIEKLFHVRSVSQGDVYRADAKDIPRIFQILYVTEGENRKSDDHPPDLIVQEKSGVIQYKGHDFLTIHFRTLTTCDSCNKPVWHFLHPPPAMECRHCHIKVHKEHYDKNEEFLAYCKVNLDQTIQAKEMLLMAETEDKQKQWVQHLSKKVSKKDIASSGNLRKLFHVRSVSQGDVYRADAKDIPRIFQIPYATVGENRKSDDHPSDLIVQEKSGVIQYKGHDFLAIHFRTLTTCDSCNKPVWHFLHPPPAMECRHCHIKVHKEHYDKNEEFLAYCKVNLDQTIQAKEMLLMAETEDKQKQWVQHLSKKVSKKDIASSGNLRKLFHVRSVSQGDVYRADAKDIPRIFQIPYATVGENRKSDDHPSDLIVQEKSGVIQYKGHDFLAIHFRTLTTCDSCNKPVWHFLHPPPAMECRHCHIKVHKEHYDKNEEFLAYCKVNLDQTIQAKEMLLMAETEDKQKQWVQHLSKKVSKKDIASSGNLRKLFHVRSVSQGDVYRADAKDIPRIFQIPYATVGENRKSDDHPSDLIVQEKSGVIQYKGHDFLAIHFRTLTTCDSCNKPVWHFLHPPPAMECRHCHIKVHKEHYDKNEEFLAYCKVNLDQTIQAKEMLLMAETEDKQKQWVQHLSNKVSKKDIASSGNLRKLFHVRSVSQGDVYRADAKDIPRIFQIPYATEGENRKSDDHPSDLIVQEKSGVIQYKGHDFLTIHFRTLTTCDSCNKPVWHFLHPPPAMECRHCHIKVHKEHCDKNEEFLAYCKVNLDQTIQAKEMLLMAETEDKQKQWVQHLSKKVSKKDIASSGNLSMSSARGTKQYSSFGAQQRPGIPRQSATLPPNSRPV